ncbi:hypothetical protein GCM10027596_14290 [Nocardioides korecus]
MTQFRIRWPVALGTSLPVPVALGALLGLVIRPVALGVLEGVVLAAVFGLLGVLRVRRRTLTVHDDVLVVQRDQYRLVVPWASVTGVQRRRHQRVMAVEELVCSGARVEAVDSRGRTSRLPEKLTGHPALTRVMVSLYAEDWRSGPIGERVRAAGTVV